MNTARRLIPARAGVIVQPHNMEMTLACQRYPDVENPGGEPRISAIFALSQRLAPGLQSTSDRPLSLSQRASTKRWSDRRLA